MEMLQNRKIITMKVPLIPNQLAIQSAIE